MQESDLEEATSVETEAVPLSEFRALLDKSLEVLGYSEDEVGVISDVLLWAQLRGNTQNAIKIPSNALVRTEGASSPAVVRETASSAAVDGHQSLGMLAVYLATQVAVQKAKEQGMAVVTVSNTSSTTGALGYWAEQIAGHGLIGLVLCQSPEYVAPHGSSEPIFGTNPIAVGIPAAEGPLVMDLATSAASWYGLLDAEGRGESVAEDVGYDRAGQPTTRPGAILDGGAIRVFDRSHKGSHLALMVEILGGALAGGAVEDKLASRNWGSLLLALDPALAGNGDVAAFQARTAALLARVKGARRAPGFQEILLPGERGSLQAEQCRAAGVVPISSQLYDQLRAAAAGHASTASSSSNSSSSAAHQRAPDRAHEPRNDSAPSNSHTSTASSHPGRLGPTLATRLVHPPKVTEDPYGAASPPLYQTATFSQVSAVECGPYDYSRSGNPTRAQLEAHMAELEGACRSFAFASGMAALSAVLRLAHAGDHVVAGDDLYGGTSRLLAQIAPGLGVEVTHVDTARPEAVRAALIPGRTKLVMLESPTNPRMQICDIATLSAIAHEVDAVVVVDNSILAPVFQQPLALGADISMTSATKFIAGHSDVTGGTLSVKQPDLAQRIYFYQNAEGTGLGPFDCWLAMRGLKTMALRMERQAATASILAHWLAAHPLVTKVNYPGLPGHPGRAVHAAQATSGGSLLSFETGSVAASRAIAEQTKLFKITVSFGSVTSLISLPCYMSHASIPAAVRAQRGLPDDLVRVSVGIEDPADLLADLEQAMEKAAAEAGLSAGAPRVDAARLAAADREQQLMQRVAALEAQLRSMQQ